MLRIEREPTRPKRPVTQQRSPLPLLPSGDVDVIMYFQQYRERQAAREIEAEAEAEAEDNGGLWRGVANGLAIMGAVLLVIWLVFGR